MKQLALVAISVLGLVGCMQPANVRESYDPYVRKLGFDALYPPREGFGPSVVYELVDSGTGDVHPRILCTSLFNAEVKPTENGAALDTMSFSGDSSVSLGLGILSGVLKDLKSADASLKAQGTNKITITYTDAKIQELPQERRFTAAGTRIPVKPACAAVIKEKKDSGTLGSVLVVERGLLVSTFGLKAERTNSASASASFDIKGLVTVKPGIDVKSTGTDSLEFKFPMFVGINSVSLTGFIPTFDAGPETWEIKATPSTTGRVLLMTTQ